MVFYRKYRPQKLSDLIGQDHVVETFLSQLKSGKISHGYLFCGPKGTGKTSTARIFAKAVNCEVYRSKFTVHSKRKTENRQRSTVNRFGEPCNKCTSCLSVADGSHLDLIEIDAASNRLIEDVRDLREKIKLSPVSSRFKVYIIDEVHMLTKEAFNAFLKTLEEPPPHAIFILCTTEVAKLPQTIISRVQRFNFTRATDGQLVETVEKIAKKEGINIKKEAILAIAKASDGSFRDAVSILDQLSASNKVISKEDVRKVSILSDWNHTFTFVRNLSELNLKEVVLTLENLAEQGMDISFFTKEVILFLEKLLFIKIGISAQELELDGDQVAKMEVISEKMPVGQIQNLMKFFLIAETEIKIYPLPQIPLILAACKYCLPNTRDNPQVKESQNKNLTQAKRASRRSSKTLTEIEAKWGEFINRLRPINTQIMAILKATSPLSYQNGSLTLEVFYRFHKEKLEEPKALATIEGVLKEVMGIPISLKFMLAQKKTIPPKSVRESDVVDVDLEHIEKLSEEIQEIFSK